ncbi:MAG: RNA-binding S4 domain-containing protein [Blastocatellia bacterium]|nr:RNA-binding S4 domain-containing protein [Blastocatellia bacterium]
MILDVFLKLSRIAVRRSVAQQLCDAGLVSLNGTPAKSSKEVSVGDELQITKGPLTRTYRIEKVPSAKQVSRSESGTLYTLISENSDDGAI